MTPPAATLAPERPAALTPDRPAALAPVGLGRDLPVADLPVAELFAESPETEWPLDETPVTEPSVADLPAALRPARARRIRLLPTRLGASLAGLGPAIVAAIAYVDPGNFATNITAGSTVGYLLVWVVVAANLIAVLVQNLSAKLGLATGRSLPELCRDHYRPAVSRALWIQAEVVIIATDIAEVVGGAVALNLLFGLPLVQGVLVTAVVAFGLMILQGKGAGRFQLVVGGLFAVILIGFLITLVSSQPDASAVATGLVPHLDGADSLLLATGILGATVMPHAIYLHSGMTSAPQRTADPRASLRRHRRGIAVALGLAGVVNASMLVIAAALFHDSGPTIDTLEGAHAGLGTELGPSAALLFALALLASGFASTGVGSYAGQIVITGFVRMRIPMVVRRGAALIPAIVILLAGVDPTQALVLSQVVLSFGIPFALVPLIVFTSRRRLMGSLVNRRATTYAACAAAVLIIALNAMLVVRI